MTGATTSFVNCVDVVTCVYQNCSMLTAVIEVAVHKFLNILTARIPRSQLRFGAFLFKIFN